MKENCNYGYGQAPRAIAQAALATAWYLSSEFGITGFQASFVMWDFILDWQYRNNKCGLKMIDYDDMLYPQYEHKFVPYPAPSAPAARPAPLSHPHSPWFPARFLHTATDSHRYISQLES